MGREKDRHLCRGGDSNSPVSIDDAAGAATAAFGTGDSTSGANDSDEALVERARARDRSAFELLMRRHNQRVYRVVRSLLRDADEIEDVIQQATCRRSFTSTSSAARRDGRPGSAASRSTRRWRACDNEGVSCRSKL